MIGRPKAGCTIEWDLTFRDAAEPIISARMRMIPTVVGEGGTRKGCREAFRIARDTVPVGLEGSDMEDLRRGRGYVSDIALSFITTYCAP